MLTYKLRTPSRRRIQHSGIVVVVPPRWHFYGKPPVRLDHQPPHPWRMRVGARRV
ncbi:hypothetical protein JNJ66_02780 [Candidatus Saccharibacteria bacterium]|nr:hypothetical protein [Candidatus Saccharibacteria bacterium]